MSPTVAVPDSVEGVLATLAAGAEIIAGGTQVMPRVNTTAHGIETLVSLRQAGLGGIEVSGSRATVGAATTLAQVGADERLGFLRGVVESIASPSIRNLATVGGNLFVAQPYGDLAVALLALDAEVDVAGPDGAETRPVGAVLDAGVPAGHVVAAVRFDIPEGSDPLSHPDSRGQTPCWFYTKAMRRRLNSASIVTVAAVIEIDAGAVATARIALGGAGTRPVRASAAEAALVGRPLEREHVEAAGAAAAEAAEPFSDAYASAWYRRRVLPVHVRRALLGE
jgi:CO/xanthine dehydrogenase FAD-binding subunit